MIKQLLTLSLSLLTFNYTLHAAEQNYPLHEAARNGDIAKVRELLKYCDVNEKNYIGMTPLDYAINSNNYELAQELLARIECRVNEKDTPLLGWTPLHWAACGGDQGIIQILLANSRCNPNEKDNYGRTPLDQALGRGYHDIVYLIRHWHTFVKGLHISLYTSILAGNHARCGATSPLRALPNHELRQILSYVLQGTCIYSHEDIVRYVAIAQLQQQRTGWCTIS